MITDDPRAPYDLVLTGAHICDPATAQDRRGDLAVNGDRIAAIGIGLASQARQVIDLDGKLVTPGWVDLHVHVFEWMTTFGLPPTTSGFTPVSLPRSIRVAPALTRSRPSSITSPIAR